ncbi:hypothetical protein BGW38_000696 [Lunasporangiospora selenospora]|uniref:F-box domain-containing protein n=1 Tax=Lunasporangiospora selenospora TaxID=979761 RepID=A0A9P6G2U1_9FUNG|nr:hypothetical protein BGW38_000696 [Lunasporangiospora selenospora]
MSANHSTQDICNDPEMAIMPPKLTLESLPLECIQAILEHLSSDCHSLYALLLMNRAWFRMVIPFLYRSPFALIDATWPKLSPYSQVLKKELPQQTQESSSAALSTSTSAAASPRLSGCSTAPTQAALVSSSSVAATIPAEDEGSFRVGRIPHAQPVPDAINASSSLTNYGRSYNSSRRTSMASSVNGGNSTSAGTGGASYSFGYGMGYGYAAVSAPRSHSRSSSHSSTRSMASGSEAFFHGRNNAMQQKDQRDRLVKRKKMQVLWLLLNCTLTEQEVRAIKTRDKQPLVEMPGTLEDDLDENGPSTDSQQSFLSLDRNLDVEVNVDYFCPCIDYLSYYTHFYHPGLRFFIWKLFPNIDDAFTIEWRLLSHTPERIREIFLESVQLQHLSPLVTKLEIVHRIRTCHECWDIPGSIEFMKKHNQHFGTVRMLELEAYLPDNHDTVMNDDMSRLIQQVEHLKVLELSGFESLRTELDLIPKRELKVLRLNCGSLSSSPAINSTTTTAATPTGSLVINLLTNGALTTHPPGVAGAVSHNPGLELAAVSEAANIGNLSSEASRMSLSGFLSQCRQLDELLLRSVDENLLDWAVQERREFEACYLTVGLLTPFSGSPSALFSLPRPFKSPMVPLRVIELSGTDSEHVAMTISQAAEAFQDTLEVIKANSYSYQSNRTRTQLTWKFLMPRLRVLKIVGRSNLPFDFRSLQHCPALKILDISKYSGMRGCSEALLLNMKYLKQLEYLGLSSFDHLTDSTLRTILGCMPRLKHLRLAIGDTPISTSSPYAQGYGHSYGHTYGNSSSVTSSLPPPSFGATSTSPLTSVPGNGSSASGSGSGSGLGGSLAPKTTGGSVAGNSGSGSDGSGTEMPLRSPFAALSLASSTSTPSQSTSSHSSLTTSPAPPPGTINIIFGQIQHPFYSSHGQANSSASSGSGGVGGVISSGPALASTNSTTEAILSSSSYRSTTSSSLMDRFHLENNFLSLEGILDAIEGFSDSKDQLENLSIVLGKLDFEEHYRRLEQYKQTNPSLEITVYRYAHGV